MENKKLRNIRLVMIIFSFFLFNCNNTQIDFDKSKSSSVDANILNTDTLISIKDGIYKKFYSNGVLECIGFINDGESDSIWRWYYPNGNILEISYMRSTNKAFGNRYLYYENGNLETYLLSSLDGPVFKKNYKKDGSFLSFEGQPYFVYYNRDTIKLNDSYDFMFYLAVDSNSIANVDLEVYHKNKLVETRNEKNKELQVSCCSVLFYDKILDKLGSWKFKVHYNILDTIENIKFEDVKWLNVEVVEN